MSKCPCCGEPVSQFAAGCAICGADLEGPRREAAARRARLPSLPVVSQNWTSVALVAVVVLAFPLVGAIVAFFAINKIAPGSTDQPVRVALISLAVLGLVLLVAPGTRFGLLSLLGAA